MRVWESLKITNKTKRVAYCCVSLQFANGRCTCAHGKELSLAKDNSISARLILNGTIPTVCKGCELYSEEVIKCA